MIEEKKLVNIGYSYLITIPVRWIRYHQLDKEGKVKLEVTDDFIIIKPVKENGSS